MDSITWHSTEINCVPKRDKCQNVAKKLGCDSNSEGEVQPTLLILVARGNKSGARESEQEYE